MAPPLLFGVKKYTCSAGSGGRRSTSLLHFFISSPDLFFICYPIICCSPPFPLSIYIPKWPAQSHGLTSARMLGEFFFPSAFSDITARGAPSYRQKSATRAPFNHERRRCCLVALDFLLNFFYYCFLATASTRYPVKFPHRLPRC